MLSQAVIARERAPGMTAAAFAYVMEKLLGIHRRFRAVLARMADGKMRPDKPRKKRARKPKPEVDPRLPRGWRKWLPKDTREKPIWRVLRTGRFAWLCNVLPTIPGFRHSAAIRGTHLRQLLDDPEMRALLAASRKLGDALRPLCWMLGVETALLYPKPPAGPAEDDGVASAAVAAAPVADDFEAVAVPPPDRGVGTLGQAGWEGVETPRVVSSA